MYLRTKYEHCKHCSGYPGCESVCNGTHRDEDDEAVIHEVIEDNIDCQLIQDLARCGREKARKRWQKR